MKKILLIIGLTISMFYWNSCIEDSQGVERLDGNELFNSTNDLYKFVKVHSQLLRKTNNNYKWNRGAILSNKLPSETDTLGLILFHEQEFYNNLQTNPISFNGKTITVDDWIIVPDSIKVNIFRKSEVMEPLYMSPNHLRYFNKVVNIVDISETPSEAKSYLDLLFIELELEQYTNEEKLAIQIMIGIAYDSFDYWYNYAIENPRSQTTFVNKRGKIKSFWTAGNIYADLYAGAQSAVWGGLVAGPLGAVMVGVSGAFIGSGVKQAISNVLGD